METKGLLFFFATTDGFEGVKPRIVGSYSLARNTRNMKLTSQWITRIRRFLVGAHWNHAVAKFEHRNAFTWSQFRMHSTTRFFGYSKSNTQIRMTIARIPIVMSHSNTIRSIRATLPSVHAHEVTVMGLPVDRSLST